MTNEIWKSIPEFEGYYEASSLGRGRSVDRLITDVLGRKHFWRGRILTQRATEFGHLNVQVSRWGTSKPARVHRLIAAAFHGPQPVSFLEIRHLNGDPTDNRPENLAWGTRSENQQDAVSHGTHPSTRKTQCPQSHPLDLANTYLYRGKRSCRKCRLAAVHRYNSRTRKASA
jgi:hypothetical protein